MKILSSKILLPVVGAAIAGASIVGTNAVSAATPNHSGGNKLTPAQREARYQSRMDELVKQGKITTSQEQEIITEHDKLVSELKAAKGSSQSVKQQTFQNVRTEAEDWAKANNLPVQLLIHPHRPGMRHHIMGGQDDSQPTTGGTTPSQAPAST